jgi:membrane protease subunit HflK
MIMNRNDTLQSPRRLARFMPWLFNLNDGRWGRDPNETSQSQGSEQRPDEARPNPQEPQRPASSGRRDPQGPPDLDELWRDLSRKLNGLWGKGQGGSDGGGPNGPSSFGSGMGPSRFGLGLGALVLALVWLASGFFIVQEGQQAVITQFGKYHSTVGAGINWRLPYPVQRHELVYVTQIRSIDIGRDSVVKSTGLRDSAMLTEDENIVEIKFAVQYRLTDARQYLFESKNPVMAVTQAAETAVREVVGQMKMDTALSEERDQIAPRVRAIMQKILDRYKVGIEVVAINMQQGGIRPPEQVQAAFDDVLKAGQERERAKNEAEAYSNDVVPRAVGAASRLKQEAEAYQARIVAQAQGDAQRFKSLLTEYQKAPQVTRDRLYLENMQQVFSNVSKVLVESRQGSNLLYLPLDQLIQGVAPSANRTDANNTPMNLSGSSTPSPATNSDSRVRDERSRERDYRQ